MLYTGKDVKSGNTQCILTKRTHDTRSFTPGAIRNVNVRLLDGMLGLHPTVRKNMTWTTLNLLPR